MEPTLRLPRAGTRSSRRPALGIETTTGIAAASRIQRGVLGLVRGLAVELGDRAIRTNAVLPGILDDRHPLPGAIPLIRGDQADRRGTSTGVADAVAYPLSDDAAYVTGVELGARAATRSGTPARWTRSPTSRPR